MNHTSLWELYSSKMEYNSEIRDKYDRTVISYTRPGNMLDPDVSTFMVEKGFQPKYPDNKPFAVCLSHDVDDLFVKPSKKNLLKQLVTANVGNLKTELNRNFQRKIDPVLDLNRVIALERKHNIKSTYYFLAVEKDNVEDYNYSLEEVQDYFAAIQELGSEIGLHGSKVAFNDLTHLKTEKERLEKFGFDIVGYRNHYLKFETPTTWNILSQAGIKYDTTFGAAACPGFRNGMCFPYQPYDLQRKEWIDLYEIPLIAMDVSFFSYLNLNYDMGFELFKKLVKTVKECKGVFTFLWHNNYLVGEMGAFYEKCIDYLVNEQAWFATGGEMVDWWESNDYFHKQKEILETIKP